MDLDIDEPAAVGARAAARCRRRRRARHARARPPSGRSGRGRPRVRLTTWNQPSASETYRSDPSGSQRAPTSMLVSPATTSVAPGGHVDQRDLRRLGRFGLAVGHHGEAAAVGRPVERRRRRCRPRSGPWAPGGRGTAAGRPRRGTGASTSQICDQPRRREMNASRRPSGDQRGCRPLARLADDAGDPRAVGLHDPDLVVADIGQAPAVGRPLRDRRRASPTRSAGPGCRPARTG